MEAQTTKLRPELSDLPIRMTTLPVDERGYPVPWFVEWIDGQPEFRCMSAVKWRRAIKEKLCWVCGQKTGVWLAFVLGPMCGVTRTTVEPPCHLDCARWSAKNCPFLARPHMVRRGEEELEARGAKSIGGVAIRRNPGVTLIWVCRTYNVWAPKPGEKLIEVGDPDTVEFWKEGRTATRKEIDHSIETALPQLQEIAATQSGGLEELEKQVKAFERYLP